MNDSKVTAVTANHENRAFLCSVLFLFAVVGLLYPAFICILE